MDVGTPKVSSIDLAGFYTPWAFDANIMQKGKKRGRSIFSTSIYLICGMINSLFLSLRLHTPAACDRFLPRRERGKYTYLKCVRDEERGRTCVWECASVELEQVVWFMDALRLHFFAPAHCNFSAQQPGAEVISPPGAFNWKHSACRMWIDAGLDVSSQNINPR